MEEKNDTRVGWVIDQIQKVFKTIKYEKLRSSEQFSRSLLDFFDSPSVGPRPATAPQTQFMSICESGASIQYGHGFLSSFKGILLYLQKAEGTTVTADNISDTLRTGTVIPDSLQQFQDVIENAYFPLLTNRLNQENWTEIAVKEVDAIFNSFLSDIQIVKGRIQGHTCLPLPADLTNLPAPGKSKDKLHLFEGCIITWTKQIKDVIRLDPEEAITLGTNPGPLSELDFWDEKADDLYSIYAQLQGERIRKVLTFLDMSKSTYNASFAKLCKEVFRARGEAQDNSKYLRPLRSWFEQLVSSDFDRIAELFRPVLHIIHLIWKLSSFYNSTTRLVILLRKICNAIIDQGMKYVTPEHLFIMIENEEFSTALGMINTLIRVCGSFKSAYFEYKDRISRDWAQNEWRIQNNSIFVRLDSFLERCHDILTLTDTIQQFSSLSKIEVGGTKGKTLTTSVVQIHTDFLLEVETLRKSDYDMMDTSALQFDDDFYQFKSHIRELERRLSSVICQGFDDCSTISGKFKLLLSFEGLLSRQIIYDEMERKQLTLLKSFGDDIQLVSDLFHKHREHPYIPTNLPPISGALIWARSLRTRVTTPMEQLQQLNASLLEREEAREIQKNYTILLNSLSEFEEIHLEKWGQNIEESSAEKLKLPLLRVERETGMMMVNFDPTIVRLLREVKYFLFLGLQVPESTLGVYKKVETFRQQTGNLELIVNMYNRILKELLPIERPLVQSYLVKMEKALLPGTSAFTWKGHGIDIFIIECMNTVREGDAVFQTLRSNMQQMVQALESWNAEPLMSRDPKPVSVEVFDQDFQKYANAKYEMIREGGKKIHGLVKETSRKLKVSQGQSDWKNYVDYLSSIVVDGMAQVVVKSLRYLIQQIDCPQRDKSKSKTGTLPMLEISLDLMGKQASFIPHIGDANTSERSLKEFITSWVDHFFSITSLVKRLDNSSEGSYLKELQQDERVTTLLSQVNRTLASVQARCETYLSTYTKYSFLWTSNIDEVFQQFLEEATDRSLTSRPFVSGQLRLEMFDEKLHYYHKLHDQIEDFSNVEDIAFLRINSQPIKQALNACITKWIFTYSNYLQKVMRGELVDVHGFMQRINSGLSADVKPGDKDGLMKCMEHIRDVRKNMDSVGRMFEPLRSIASLLKKHQIVMEDFAIGRDNILDFLEAAPLQWDNSVDMTFKRKEIILPLQNQMASNIRRDISYFRDRLNTFRADFLAKSPMTREGFLSDMAYSTIDQFYGELDVLVTEAKSLSNLEEIFELEQSQFRELNDSLEDLRNQKTVWDINVLIQTTFATWMSTLWADIDTDELLAESKALQTQLLRLSKKVHNWPIYQDLLLDVKNMSVTLPLINELHSEAMRDRHWKGLMQVTKKKFEKGSDFSLNDVVKLNLHEHVDDVQEIIEIAQKEMKVDQKLKSISEVWAAIPVGYAMLPSGNAEILNPSPDVMDNLEDHQMQLQTMIGMGRFVEFFRDQILHWQKQLSEMEGCLRLWIQVQNKWVALESIFMHSADIQSQLPEDTQRFRGIDATYREILVESHTKRLILEICSREGLFDQLQTLWRELERCQKALDDYLETKKGIFSRFYFVSNQSLLDILSNGDNPPLIQHHFGDCFNGISTLEFLPAAEEVQNHAISMVSKDEETVRFREAFVIRGVVENWLNDFVGFMQRTLKEILEAAFEGAQNWSSEDPREQWLFHYPAQLALLASQIMWTEEAETALTDLENGSEDAVRRYLDVCTTRLESLIRLVQGDLSECDRTKIITLITIDVHNRDIVQGLITRKVEGPSNFMWQSQLRCYWDEAKHTCQIRIVDFRTEYSYEYIGNTGRLVITPLTDRCYITLSVAMRLTLGGAPAGPAGTGKTETTKDFARALGLPCYVFNCSDQMNYQTLGDIFKGLSQTGAWGCFDEFNRICIEVLSVIATQVKCILDAIRFLHHAKNRPEEFRGLPDGKPSNCVVGYFDFMGCRLRLMPTVGIFITMNPGYAGRTELPENIKALFRSCAMIRPDLIPICENMLMAEGFVKARPMAVKFVTLYRLCSELLSQQIHYDWGLRAVKSVLRVAGMLKRADPGFDEESVLMRALRDFNIPKIISADAPIFLRLISDLFPNMSIPTKVNDDLKARCLGVGRARNLVTEDEFVLKVVQLQEIIDVRHSVMILGPAGAGKTTVWRSLVDCHNYQLAKPTCMYETVNPKSVTSDELYGFMNLSKDWTDGCLSIIMRNMSKNSPPYTAKQQWKFIVLDGDIDAVWIESMNTVMDDNKVLTLVSNERIPLSPAMRMFFEIHTLRNATPATVSRAGILFINETDIGWKPCLESWLAARHDLGEVPQPFSLISTYLEESLTQMRQNKVEFVVPLPVICLVQNSLRFLESLLARYKVKSAEAFEMCLIFSCVWGLGGALLEDKGTSHRKRFDDIWRTTFKKYPFPPEGTVFDYNLGRAEESAPLQFVPWSSQIAPYVHSPEVPMTHIQVDTQITVSLSSFLELLVEREYPIMFVGAAGTGKTLLIKNYLKQNEENKGFAVINCNYYTDSKSLQKQLEDPIDKRSGRIYGPPASKKLIYFIDDLNMPFVEFYGTQTPIALLRQFVDYRNWFDRTDLGLRKTIVDVQLIAAMNPKAGSFTVNPRLQRHFATFSVAIPGPADMTKIFGSILSSHVAGFPRRMQELSSRLVSATLDIYQFVSEKFLPTAVKFHYLFNLRDIRNLFQALCWTTPEYYNATLPMTRLWVHECTRVFQDRLVGEQEITKFSSYLADVCKKWFEDETEAVFQRPIVFTTFAQSIMAVEPPYLPVKTGEEGSAQLYEVLTQKLQEYNETHSIMDLVLFDQAMEHVTRICRILQTPQGNALLVGVGGSGKQSLCRLAAFIMGIDVFQMPISSQTTIPESRESLKDLYRKVGVKPATPLVFIITDTQIFNEQFLVYINDILSSGFIPDLFSKDEMDSIVGSLRNLAKASGVSDTRNSLVDFFVDRVKHNLHVVLCFSPVGDQFRQRCRKFPGIINCCVIDWFHPWSKEALVSVASRFLKSVPLEPEELKDNLAAHMAEVHLSVNATSERYRAQTRRYNYTTPKSFLSLISLFKTLLQRKKAEADKQTGRLESGLKTLSNTAAMVAQLKTELQETLVKVDEKKRATSDLLADMGKKKAEAERQQAIADQERLKAEEANNAAEGLRTKSQMELAEAKPALDRAKEAVNCLDKASLSELKSMASPPVACLQVTTCVLLMLKNEKKDFSWENAKRMMAKVDQFKKELELYDAENIASDVKHSLEPIIRSPDFNYKSMTRKSIAAANLVTWVVNIVNFNEVYVRVKPLMESLAQAEQASREAQDQLSTAQAVVAEVNAILQDLQRKFMDATDEKAKVEAEASQCQTRLDLAERLVNGLSSENQRWGLEIERLESERGTLPGDCMLSSSFVSYLGAFNAQFRQELWKETWTQDLENREIPLREGIDPQLFITTESMVADWLNHSLPYDRISLENAAIISNSERWPLIIDPQTQGIKWLRSQEKEREVVVVRFSQPNWVRTLVQCMQGGKPLVIENIGEEIDTVLEPVLSKSYYKKGRSLLLKIAGEEVEFDPSFMLYLQTRLSNPHYRPETSAQCTIINFIVTEQGLEEQLLALVVRREQPDLEERKQALQNQFNEYKIQLLQLEDQLLERIVNAPSDILSDVPLVEGLEATKKKSLEINDAVEKGRVTENGINAAREEYRPVAMEGALLYFLCSQLYALDHMYQYSLDAFISFFFQAMNVSAANDNMGIRVSNLKETLRFIIYRWISRGLFENHKMIFLSLITFQLMFKQVIGQDKGFTPEYMQFLLRGPKSVSEDNPVDWLPQSSWYSLQALSHFSDFSKITSDVAESSARFREWYNLSTPENEKLPLDWRELDKAPFQKLLVIRCLRPDRMVPSLAGFIRTTLPSGDQFVDCDVQLNSYQIMKEAYQDSSPVNPLYFILSPGSDIVEQVDRLAKQFGRSKGVDYHYISLGQGQDAIAMRALEAAQTAGHWVLLNNLHLMPRWLLELEKKLDESAVSGSHENFRLFLASDPSGAIPVGILNRCIKLTNEPPTGLKSNLKRAFSTFNADEFDTYDSRTRGIIFGLCYFHAVLIERKTYGPKGFNMMYPFSTGDLRDSSVVLMNYMESAPARIPWDDLRYIFGEIMYGGHVVNDFDRLLCSKYLEFFLKDDLLDEIEMVPYCDQEDAKDHTFRAPLPTSYEKYLNQINYLVNESPIHLGLHPNAEVVFRTELSNQLFSQILLMQPQGEAEAGGSYSKQNVAEGVMQEILDMYRDFKFEYDEIRDTVPEPGPFQNMFLQEIEAMNLLTAEMRRSLVELEKGFAGELQISENMERLTSDLFSDRVPEGWARLAWPSLRGLGSWLVTLQRRIDQMTEIVTATLEVPRVTWLSGFFNPQSFLTAIMQSTSQRNSLELDKLCIVTEVQRKYPEEIDAASREGFYVTGLFMEGARWDIGIGSIVKALPKEMYYTLPVINCKAVETRKTDLSKLFACPVYKTQSRANTFVFSAGLKTNDPPAKWILAGVVMVMDVV